MGFFGCAFFDNDLKNRKMKKVIYSNSQGLGIILDREEQESDFFIDKNFMINETLLIPGEFTTVENFFTEPVRYVGVLKGMPNCMVFYLGSDENLFEQKKYYNCLLYLSPKRVFTKYTESSVRDYNFINGRWK